MPLYWIASSRKGLKAMPVPVQKKFGTALLGVQCGETPAEAKSLRGFTGAGVVEITEECQTGTFRAVYTVNFADAVYVLHAFKKEVGAWNRDSKARHGLDQASIRIGAAASCRLATAG